MKTIELIDKYKIHQSNSDYDPPSYEWIDNTGELIRCKDCKHYVFADGYAFGKPVRYCKVCGFEDMDDYDYCSRAERREE